MCLDFSVFLIFSLQEGVESRATQSVRVPVQNLCAVDPSLTVKGLQEALGYEFLRTNMRGNSCYSD